MASNINALTTRVVTATVSYVGKANYREAEQYIRDFRAWTSVLGEGMLIEISAVNGRFTLDFIQTFASPVFVNAFLSSLEVYPHSRHLKRWFALSRLDLSLLPHTGHTCDVYAGPTLMTI